MAKAEVQWVTERRPVGVHLALTAKEAEAILTLTAMTGGYDDEGGFREAADGVYDALRAAGFTYNPHRLDDGSWVDLPERVAADG